MGDIASDYWKPYEHIIPKEKHIQTKAEMLRLSFLLLIHYRNGTLSILS
jgi:hypothetical protein